MGRGRAKAKQTKVARELKYGGPDTDFARLQAELSGSTTDEDALDGDELEGDDEDYSKYLADLGEDDEDERRHA